MASFAGYAPASDPRVAIIVVVDEPSGLYYGAQVAAPVFKRIAEQILRYESVAPDVPEYAPHYTAAPAHSTPAPAIEPEPAPAFQDAAFKSEEPELGDIMVPDFYSKSLREVTEETLKLGLKMRSTGSGRAAAQLPQAGARVRAGAQVQVRFSTRP